MTEVEEPPHAQVRGIELQERVIVCGRAADGLIHSVHPAACEGKDAAVAVVSLHTVLDLSGAQVGEGPRSPQGREHLRIRPSALRHLEGLFDPSYGLVYAPMLQSLPGERDPRAHSGWQGERRVLHLLPQLTEAGDADVGVVSGAQLRRDRLEL